MRRGILSRVSAFFFCHKLSFMYPYRNRCDEAEVWRSGWLICQPQKQLYWLVLDGCQILCRCVTILNKSRKLSNSMLDVYRVPLFLCFNIQDKTNPEPLKTGLKSVYFELAIACGRKSWSWYIKSCITFCCSDLGFLLHCTPTNMFPFELCIRRHIALFMLRLLKV